MQERHPATPQYSIFHPALWPLSAWQGLRVTVEYAATYLKKSWFVLTSLVLIVTLTVRSDC
jgi:hypothetical protein